MTTPTISAGIVNKIKARSQAVRWDAWLKEVRTFSAYCCNINSDGIMGVAKQPVPIVSLSPNPVCLGAAMDWDLTNSYAPGSTVSAWAIDFGDETNDGGATIGTASGSHTYAAVGTYTVTITITEGLGKHTEMTREVNVVDCSTPPQKWLYASTNGQGVWFLDLNAGSTTWAARNNGLSGDALYVRSLVMKPGQDHLSDGSHEMYIATKDGIYRTTDSGKHWEKIDMPTPSNAEFSDSPAATTSELDWACIRYDEKEKGVLYAYGWKQAGSDPVLAGTVQVATGGNTSCSCAFAGNIFFDNYSLFSDINRSVVSTTPSISGRTNIWTGSFTPINSYIYGSDLDIIALVGTYGALYVSPTASATPIAPETSPGSSSYVGGFSSDYASNSHLVAGDDFGGSPPGYGWLKDIETVPAYVGSYDLGDASPGYHNRCRRITDKVVLMVGTNNLGNLFARTVFVDDVTDNQLESLNSLTSLYPCADLSIALSFLYKMSGTDYAYIYYDNSGGAWKIITITVTAGIYSISFGSPITILNGIGTPYDAAVIDANTLAVAVWAGGNTLKYVSLTLGGVTSAPVTVTTDANGTDPLAIGYASGHALLSYVKNSNGALAIASVAL